MHYLIGQMCYKNLCGGLIVTYIETIMACFTISFALEVILVERINNHIRKAILALCLQGYLKEKSWG